LKKSIEEALADLASSNDPVLFAGLSEASLPSQDGRSRYAVNIAGCVTTFFRDSFLEGRSNIVKLPRFSKAQAWQLRITGWSFARTLGGLSMLNGGKLVLSDPNRSYVASVLDARFPGLQTLIPRDESSIPKQSTFDSEALEMLERIVEDCNLKFSSGFETRIERLTWVIASGAASSVGLENALLRYAEFIPIEFGTAGLLGPLH
jgi:hypothetical protein